MDSKPPQKSTDDSARDAAAPDLVTVLLDSAEAFLERGAGPDASRCAEQALQLPASEVDRRRALAVAARSAVAARDEATAASRLRDWIEALTATSDQSGIAGAYCELGSFERSRGQLQPARDALHESLRWSSSEKPGPLRARALEELGTTLRLLGENAEAVDVLLEARRIREAADDPVALARACRALGTALNMVGRLEDALEAHRKALSLTEALGSEPERATCLNNVGGVLLQLGRNDEAERAFLDARRIFEEAGAEKMVAYVATNLGVLASYRGDAGAAEEYLQESLRIRRATGNLAGQAKSLNNLANVAQMAGRHEDAIERAEASIALLTELERTEGMSTALFAKGRAYLELDQVAEAEAAARALSKLSERSGQKESECDALLLQAEIELARNALSTADTLAQRALEFANASDLVRHAAEARRLRGEALLRSGEGLIARGLLVDAEKAFEELQSVYYLAHTRVSLAKLFRHAGAHEAAAGRLRDAVQSFQRMGNHPLHWSALLALAECEWSLSRKQSRGTLQTAARLANELGREDWAEQVADLKDHLAHDQSRSGGLGNAATLVDELARELRTAGTATQGIRQVLRRLFETLDADRTWFYPSDDHVLPEDEYLLSLPAHSLTPEEAKVVVAGKTAGDLFAPAVLGRSANDDEACWGVAVTGSGGLFWGVLAVDGVDPGGDAGEVLQVVAPLLGFALDSLAGANPTGNAREHGAGIGDPADAVTADALATHGILGRSPQIQSILDTISRIAPSSSSVLILGESGTGKELIARAIHEQSSRKDQAFEAIACPSIPRDLIEAELFGHEKGAYTGADRERIGRVELANRGTLFLDEIGDIDPATQSKLLRFLQEREFTRVGGRHSISVDVRIVAATSRDLEAEIREGRFREDLYYRLGVVPLPVPALRERGDDVRLIAETLLQNLSSRAEKELSFSPAAMEILRRYAWPGNVRELRNLVEYLVAVCTGRRISPADLPEKLRDAARAEGRLVSEEGLLRAGETLDARLMSLEGQLIRQALEHADWNQSAAARLLGVTESRLRHRMRRYGLKPPTEPKRIRRKRKSS